MPTQKKILTGLHPGESEADKDTIFDRKTHRARRLLSIIALGASALQADIRS